MNLYTGGGNICNLFMKGLGTLKHSLKSITHIQTHISIINSQSRCVYTLKEH